MYNVDVISCKLDFVTTFNAYITPNLFQQKYKYRMKISSDDMVAKVEQYVYKKLKNLYLI